MNETLIGLEGTRNNFSSWKKQTCKQLNLTIL